VPHGRLLSSALALLTLAGLACAQEGGATLKDQVWGRTVAEAAGVAAALARKETAGGGSGVAVDLPGLSARRLRFATAEDALAYGERAGGGRGLVLVEVRERQVVVLRGPGLEEADRAARVRAAAWQVLRAPDEPPALLAAARDGVVVRSGEAPDGAGQAVAGWLAQVERSGAAPRRALVAFKHEFRAVGDTVRRTLDPIPGGFWYAAIDGPEGCDLDLRLSTEEERWQSQTPATYEEVLAPADRPLALVGRLSGGAPCEAVVAAFPVAAAEPVAVGKPVMATFDRQTLPRQIHALEPHPVFTLVRLAPRGPGGDLDLALHGQGLRPVAASRGPTSDEALVVPPALGESGRRWLVVSAGRAEKRGEAKPPAPYSLVREAIPTKGQVVPGEELQGALEAKDDSWWATLRPQSTGILSVRLAGPRGNDLDVAVFGPNGECRMAASFDATEEVAIDARSETDYLVRVTRGRKAAPGAAARFSLSLESLALDRLAADAKEGPRLWTIVVGVASYERSTDDLSFTRSDALTVYSELRKRAIPGTPCVEPGRAIVLLDDRATVDNVRKALEAIASRADADDTLLFFFSGHGVSDLPDGARGDRRDELDGKDEAICTYETNGRLADDDLAALLDAVPAGRQIVILDACHSGGFAEVVKGKPGRLGIFSSLETQTSAESRLLESGALTAVMVACLIGDGDKDRNGQITVRELGRFVERQLPNRCVTCLSRVDERDRVCRGCRLDLTQPGARQRPVVLVDGIEEEVLLGSTDAALEGAEGKEK
jgi:hypothetical protein